MTQALLNYLDTHVEIIEKRLDQLVPIQKGDDKLLYLAARHALLGGGKRLRPILTLATAEMFGTHSCNDILDAACALEMVHTYSMIHDDLPCMDDDDYRRGQLTVHRQFDEGLAVLAGDYLLTYAFEILADLTTMDSIKKIKLISILSQRCGGKGMIGGQVMDLQFEGKTLQLSQLQMLHLKKTAALITASLEFGGIISDATSEQLKYLTTFGEKIGLTFQIVDDILDVTSSQMKHGRQTSSDILNNKSTYVTVLGMEKAKLYAQDCYAEALNILNHLDYDTTILKQLADFVIERNK